LGTIPIILPNLGKISPTGRLSLDEVTGEATQQFLNRILFSPKCLLSKEINTILNENPSTKIQVVGISGSLRAGSYTTLAIKIALQGAHESGASVRMLDLNDYKLPFTQEEWSSSVHSAGVLRLQEDVKAAQGIILGTPEYHASFSGVLKYALDLMGFDEFEGKMIGLIGIAGGKMGAANSLTGLRSVGRSLHAWVVPEQVSISEAWRKFDQAGHMKDAELESSLKEVGRQVARFASLHNSAHAQQFMKQWETAPDNPGGARET
jgi:FMN reductase